MVKINPETQKTRSERLATVITLIASVLVHTFLFVGGVQFYKWVEEEEKKERLMTIQRITEMPRKAVRRSQPPPGKTQAPKTDVKEEGPDPPPEGTVASDGDLEEDIGAIEEEIPPPEEDKETAVTIVTDLPAATFTVSGPVEFHGNGTFWTRKDAPTGTYTATFHPATGHKTPPMQTKTLEEKQSIVFVGKYTRSIEAWQRLSQAYVPLSLRALEECGLSDAPMLADQSCQTLSESRVLLHRQHCAQRLRRLPRVLENRLSQRPALLLPELGVRKGEAVERAVVIQDQVDQTCKRPETGPICARDAWAPRFHSAAIP